MKKNRAFFMVIFTIVIAGSAYAQELAVRFIPEMTFPLDTTFDGDPLYTIGGGGTLTADIELFNFMAPFLEFGYRLAPFQSGVASSGAIHLLNGGGGLSLFAYPISRLRLGIGAGAGYYLGLSNDPPKANVFWNARAEAGFRFSPGFTLSACGEFVQYWESTQPLLSGVSVGLTANLNGNLFSQSSAALTIQGRQTRKIFPIINGKYGQTQTSFGTATITNTESAEIQDVVVTFQMTGYTSQPTVCLRTPYVPRGGSIEAPLWATFGEQVLSLSAETKVQGELEVRYLLLDTERTARQPITIGLNGRNELTWEDQRILAAFTSPNDPAVMENSKRVAGLIRDKVRSGIDEKLQYGMGLYEGLRLSEVFYSEDLATPYASFHRDGKKVDYVQFPYQTLSQKGGDYDDLAILYAALLESVSVDAALIPMDEDVCVAFALAMQEAEARTSFLDADAFIYRGDGTAWVPVRMSQLREGFLAAWQGGSKMYNDAKAAGREPPFFTLKEGWEKYKPVSLSDAAYTLPVVADEAVKDKFEKSLNRFIDREIAPKERKMLSDMGPTGGTVRQHNSLGVLYARYGLLDKAKAWFEKAAAKDSIPALSNLGNIAILEKDYEKAVGCFQAVLKLQPDNKAALLGLARAAYELDDFAQSDVLFARVQQLDAPLAAQFAYLQSNTEGSTSRASAVADRSAMVWNEDGE